MSFFFVLLLGKLHVGDDTAANVQRLCLKASKPIRKDILEAMDMQDAGLTVGAVCVYPSR